MNSSLIDWVETIKEDLIELGLPTTLLEIQGMSTDQCKLLVRSRCSATAFNHLSKQKVVHSKMNPLSYEELKIQAYFIDGTLHSGDVKLMFSFRTRMVDVKCNYKNKYTDHSCPLCKIEEDTQEHLLACSVINTQPSEVLYTDLFGCDPVKRNLTFQALKSALEKRTKAIEEAENVAAQ